MIRSVTSLAAGLLAVGLFAGEGRADFSFQSKPQTGSTVTVTHSTGSTPPYGTTSGSTNASAFTTTPVTPGGSPFDAYCVSLNISVGSGLSNIQINSIESLHALDNSIYFPYSDFSDVGNRLEFLLDRYGNGNKSALALAIWHTIDKKFSYTGGGSALHNDYLTYINFAAAGYVSGTIYNPNAKLLVVDQGFKPYQNLIGITAVPEPASVVLAGAGLGAIGLIALRRGRRPIA